jgi:hypothetical protein
LPRQKFHSPGNIEQTLLKRPFCNDRAIMDPSQQIELSLINTVRSRPVKLFFLFFIIALASSGNVEATLKRVDSEKVLQAKIYGLSSSEKKSLYTVELHESLSGRPRWSVFRDRDAKIVAKEVITWNSKRIVKYSYERPNIKDNASVEIKDDKVFFVREFKNETKKNVVTLPKNFLIGPEIIAFIKKNWSSLVDGLHMHVNFAVLDELGAFGFYITYEPTYKEELTTMSSFKMSSDNFFVSLVVAPLYFSFDTKTKEFRQMTGRVLPVQVKDGNPIPVRANFVIQK